MNFKQYQLSDIVELISEKIKIKDLSKSEYISTDNMLPNFGGITQAENLPNSNSCNKFLKNDVLFSNIRTYFKKVWLAEFDGGCSPDVLIMRSKNENILLNEYLFLLIRSDDFINFTIASSNGAKMPRGDKNAMKKYILEIPNTEYQKECIKNYFAFDQKIHLNQQTNQTLEHIAQAIFKSWFVDFDPVRAKADCLANGGSMADANLSAMSVISGKSPDELAQLQADNPQDYDELWQLAKHFPYELVENAEFGEMPKGWEVKKIGEVLETVGGATPSTKNDEFWENGDISWATPKDLSSLNDKVLLSTDRKITQAGLKKISSGLLPINTVLLSSRAPVGYLALAKIPVAINQGFIAIKPSEILNCYYILQWCVANMAEIKGRAVGTTFAEISKSTFRDIKIIVPSQDILSIFNNKLDSIYDKISENAKENINLAKIRDELLPKLLSGEIHL